MKKFDSEMTFTLGEILNGWWKYKQPLYLIGKASTLSNKDLKAMMKGAGGAVFENEQIEVINKDFGNFDMAVFIKYLIDMKGGDKGGKK